MMWTNRNLAEIQNKRYGQFYGRLCGVSGFGVYHAPLISNLPCHGILWCLLIPKTHVAEAYFHGFG